MNPRPAPFDDPSTPELVASLLRDGFDVRLRLTGISMKPLVQPGSVLRFTPSREPKVGDIVLTRPVEGRLLAHRLTALGEAEVRTRGDSLGRGDIPIPRERLLGCAVTLESPLRLPLSNPMARLAGRLLSRIYPVAVRAFRAVVPRGSRSAGVTGGAS